MTLRPDITSLILDLPSQLDEHSPLSDAYAVLKKAVREQIEELFRDHANPDRKLPPFGTLKFPYFKMGVTDSLNLFDLDELIIFAFYCRNRGRYRRVLDIGANIGLHSIILSKCGFQVRSYEPDPVHYAMLVKNLQLNDCAGVEPFNMAVSNSAGEVEFVRVLGNTTGSHIAGAKANPYGELERFPVKTCAFGDILEWCDLIKMDVEGHEKELLLSTTAESWLKRDALVEIGSEANAQAVWDHLNRCGVHLFSQKRSWARVHNVNDMPFSYREGTLFITMKDAMPWTGGSQ